MGKIVVNFDCWVNTMPRSAGTSVRGEPIEGKQRLGTLAHGTKVHAVMVYEGDDLTTQDDDWLEIQMPASGFTPVEVPMPKPNRGIFIKRAFTSMTDPNVVTPPPATRTDRQAVAAALRAAAAELEK